MTATLTLIALLCLAALAGSARSHRPNLHPAGTLQTPRIHELYWLRGQLNHALSSRCLPARTYRWRPAYRVPPAWRPFVIQQTRGWLEDGRKLVNLCDPRNAIRHVFGPYADQALAVAACESGFSTKARNGQYLGLFQMGSWERARYGHSSTALGQAQAAYRYFVASGRDWSPWACKP